MSSIYADLPEVLFVLDLHDSGEFGNASCPHCGAEGRYVYTFACADGTTRGAMAGCFKKFRKHRYAKRMERILTKALAAHKQGRKLASWDTDVEAAIRDFHQGVKTEAEADAIIRRADLRKQDYMRSKGYCR